MRGVLMAPRVSGGSIRSAPGRAAASTHCREPGVAGTTVGNQVPPAALAHPPAFATSAPGIALNLALPPIYDKNPKFQKVEWVAEMKRHSVLDSLTAADVRREPYPHVVIENCLPGRYFDELAATYPSNDTILDFCRVHPARRFNFNEGAAQCWRNRTAFPKPGAISSRTIPPGIFSKRSSASSAPRSGRRIRSWKKGWTSPWRNSRQASGGVRPATSTWTVRSASTRPRRRFPAPGASTPTRARNCLRSCCTSRTRKTIRRGGPGDLSLAEPEEEIFPGFRGGPVRRRTGRYGTLQGKYDGDVPQYAGFASRRNAARALSTHPKAGEHHRRGRRGLSAWPLFKAEKEESRLPAQEGGVPGFAVAWFLEARTTMRRPKLNDRKRWNQNRASKVAPANTASDRSLRLTNLPESSSSRSSPPTSTPPIRPSFRS